jgi:hypothetical protein
VVRSLSPGEEPEELRDFLELIVVVCRIFWVLPEIIRHEVGRHSVRMDTLVLEPGFVVADIASLTAFKCFFEPVPLIGINHVYSNYTRLVQTIVRHSNLINT